MGIRNAGLIEANDGNLYGVTLSGGRFSVGVFYRLNVIAQWVLPTADAYVRAGTSAGTNFGTVSTLLVKKGESADNTSRSYLTFDIRKVDTLTHVALRVFGRVASVTTSAVNITVYAVNDTAWNERLVTWDSRPDLGAVLGTVRLVGVAPHWLEIDVTAFVRTQRAAGFDAVTLAFLRETVRPTYRQAGWTLHRVLTDNGLSLKSRRHSFAKLAYHQFDNANDIQAASTGSGYTLTIVTQGQARGARPPRA